MDGWMEVGDWHTGTHNFHESSDGLMRIEDRKIFIGGAHLKREALDPCITLSRCSQVSWPPDNNKCLGWYLVTNNWFPISLLPSAINSSHTALLIPANRCQDLVLRCFERIQVESCCLGGQICKGWIQNHEIENKTFVRTRKLWESTK